MVFSEDSSPNREKTEQNTILISKKISMFVEFERKTTFVVIFLNMDRILYGSSYFHVNQSSLTYGGKKSYSQVIDYH